jgi:peroxiredoxin
MRLGGRAALTSLALLLAACGGPDSSHKPVAGSTPTTLFTASGAPSSEASGAAPRASTKSGASGPVASATSGPDATSGPKATGTPSSGSGPSTQPTTGTQLANAAIVVNTSCRKPASSVGTGVALKGQRPPGFTGTTVDCNSLEFAPYTNGKPTLVTFFASWCDPCHKEAADLEAVYEKYHASIGFQVVGVETQDESGDASWFYKKAHWSFPAVYDDGEKIEKAWNTSGAITTLPASFWIHPDGTISSIVIGEMSRSQMESDISKL